jgi:hypothetical protein
MRRIVITAALLLGTAAPGALAAQQHQHGATRDTAQVRRDAAQRPVRADSADRHRTHPDTAHQRMMGDSAHHAMRGDSAHREMMRADTAHQRMMADPAHHRMMHGDSARHQTMPGDPAHHQPMHGDSARQRMMNADSAHPTNADAAHDHAPESAAPGAGHEGHGGAPGTQAAGHAHAEGAPGGHRMLMQPLGDGWSLMGMAQAYPMVTTGLWNESSPLSETEPYLTQPALMINLESPGSAFVLRSTLNFEGITQPGGELTAGGWGEGFIDRRHPHTLLHEFMLSANLWNAGDGALSVSAGKGFAPYGTDDPMSRPVAKYPTNHHLSQILERWTANVVYLRGPWSVEAGLFGGAEPEGPYDLSNYEAFGDSWSARVIRRFGGTGTSARWEVAGSYGRVAEAHHDGKERTALVNGYVRHAAAHRFGTLYTLVEASRSEPEGEALGYYALLAESMAGIGRHRPYVRMEYSTRPEWEREDGDVFRYHHDDEPVGASRWMIATVGYGWQLRGFPVSTMPFAELQHNRVWRERGQADVQALFGDDRFWGVSLGVRLFLGSAGPMRMGSYGVLDDMTSNHRPPPRKGR